LLEGGALAAACPPMLHAARPIIAPSAHARVLGPITRAG
jgi:hypothetical protein